MQKRTEPFRITWGPAKHESEEHVRGLSPGACPACHIRESVTGQIASTVGPCHCGGTLHAYGERATLATWAFDDSPTRAPLQQGLCCEICDWRGGYERPSGPPEPIH